MPFYLTTREFFRLPRERLAPDGVIALNVSTTPEDHALADGIAGTLATEFPQVLQWQALRFNQLVIGLARPMPQAELAARLRRIPRRIAVLGRLLAGRMRPAKASDDPWTPWTDDRAPVEWITDKMILDSAARGRNQAEQLLPTAPPQ